MTLRPLLDAVPGLERIDLQFGAFPSEMERIASLPGDNGYRETSVTLSASSGFLRAVAVLDGVEVPGPLTPVVSGTPLPLGHELPESPIASILPPSLKAVAEIEKNHRIFPDLSPVDPETQDFLLVGWASTPDRSKTIRFYPDYPERESNASYQQPVEFGEWVFLAAHMPGESGTYNLRPLRKLDLRVYKNTQLADLRLLAVDRAEFPYLEWMRDVRHAATRLHFEAQPTPSDLIALASRDPYGSAPYLLPAVISALLSEEDEAAAVAYLRDLDPALASPFHKGTSFQYDLRTALRNVVASEDSPPSVRWEAALANLRNGAIDPLTKFDLLYQAADTDSEKRAEAREQLLRWLRGKDVPGPLADEALRREVPRFSIPNSVVKHPLSEVLRHDYDPEIDALLRQRLTDVRYDLAKDPAKNFVFTTLLPDPGSAGLCRNTPRQTADFKHQQLYQGCERDHWHPEPAGQWLPARQMPKAPPARAR